MKIQQTELEGVLLIESELVIGGKGEISEDMRGFFVETYNREKYHAAGITTDFLEDDISVSKKNVLRGMHGDDRTWKLITCTHGAIFFVAVYGKEGDPRFGKWQSFELSDVNRLRILVPPYYASGYVVLSDKAIVNYKQSELFRAGGQFSFKWNDPRFGIKWPEGEWILSSRDAA
ncbi:MAG: dTDP-4-keto-6-deoxy-D-glucose epimerase [Candidatus Pacebacteria bacterium]|nr:dTDP-4-keto-6-deoxy-D-glucose epimerase [Candidatus Paceibacterota bacterium]